MTGFWIVTLAVSAVLTLLFVLILRGGAAKEVEEAEERAKEEVQNDISLRDAMLADDIRERVGTVPDRLPPGDPARPASEKRKGRRGAV